MTKYLLIESRDPFESRDDRFLFETAAGLCRSGHEVTVFLVQNGVLAARSTVPASHLPALSEAGVAILADDFSLRERGIAVRDLDPRVAVSGAAVLVDLLTAGDTKAIWH